MRGEIFIRLLKFVKVEAIFLLYFYTVKTLLLSYFAFNAISSFSHARKNLSLDNIFKRLPTVS